MTVKACKDFESEKMGEKKAVNVNVKESPKKKVHNQVLRIREEDSHLGEDIGERFSSVKDNVNVDGYRHHVDVDVNVNVFLTRPILPCSPLSGKTTTTVKALHL